MRRYRQRKGVTPPIETKALHQGVTEPRALQVGVTSIVGPTAVVPPGTPRPIPQVTQADIDALPSFIKDSILNTVNYRLKLGLYNDHEERMERAATYHAVTGR